MGAFILSLALAFNDLKNLEWVHWQLQSGWDRSKPDGIAPYEGQLHGMRAWHSRMAVALVHEVLLAIRKAQDTGVLDEPDFVASLPGSKSPLRRTWETVCDAAIGQAGRTRLHKFLLYVRNNAAYHYYQPQALAGGYHCFYLAPESNRFAPRNAHAYTSLGGTMESTRFYFADAAALMVLAEQHADNDIDHATISALLKFVNGALRFIVEAYLRQRGKTLGFAPASQPAGETAGHR